MCGYVLGFGDILESELVKATNKILHRGPDKTNFHIDKKSKLFLGHNRLTIIDEKFGSQPMFDETKNLILLYNGEIYNQFELRKELEERGYKFKSKRSDTEVVIAGYKIWGNKVFSKMDGQFAICLYDKMKNQILLARDKFGEKPLFYYINNKKIIVASELSVFKEFSDVKIELDKLSLKKFFIYSYVPPPRTIYKNIFKVEHSTFITIQLNNKTYHKTEYFIPSLSFNNKYKDDDFIEECETLIRESIKSRMLSDVDVSLFLSGGLDSSIISYYSKKEKPNIQSFSLSVDYEMFNEKSSFNFMNEFLNIQNSTVKLDKKLFQEKYNQIFEKLDEPIGASTYITMFYLCEYAKSKTKVVLTGDGADELFGGYDVLRYQHLIDFINKYKLNNFFAKILSVVNIDYLNFISSELKFKLLRLKNGINKPINLQNTSFLSSLDFEELNELFEDKFDHEETFEELKKFESKYSEFQDYQKSILYFVNFYIPNLICSRSDKAGMFNSLEIRSPFLNEKILNLVLSIPRKKSYLLRNKKILREIASKKIHKRFSKIKKKGFTYPIFDWLKYEKNFPREHNMIIKNNPKLFDLNKEEIVYRNFNHNLNVIRNFKF